MAGVKRESSDSDCPSTQWCGPLSYASVVMSARDTQHSRKEHQQRALVAAADGNNLSVSENDS